MIVNMASLKEIAEVEFSEIVTEVLIGLNEMRIVISDGSYCDIWFSLKLEGRYSYHWERNALDGTIYRHDNAPHRKWQTLETFPHHFHNASEDFAEESNLPEDPQQALRFFLQFVKEKLLVPVVQDDGTK